MPHVNPLVREKLGLAIARYGAPLGSDEPRLRALMRDFCPGHPLEVISIDEEDQVHVVRVGMNLGAGEVPQYVVPQGRWFGSRLAAPHAPDAYALVGCTVAPGFDFADFELADRGALTAQHPQHKSIIEALTR